MNSHKNARLTFEGRKLLIERIALMGLTAAAEAAGVSPRTARKWFGRVEQEGLDGLRDRSSRPSRTRATVDKALHLRRRVHPHPGAVTLGSRNLPVSLPKHWPRL